MKESGVFLNKYAGRGMLFFILTIVLLRLSGADTALAQSCGKWSVVTSPNVGSGQNYLYGVTAITPNDVWAVGTSQSATLTEHWNGTQWSVVNSPSIGTYYPTLFSVAALATNDAWAVGYSGTYPTYTAMIEHWNGTQWKLVTSPSSGAQLTGVTAISTNDVWAVGTIGTYQPMIEHWNGTQWSVISHPNQSTSMYAVTAVSTGDVWAVGGTLYAKRHEALIEHWNGTSWKMVYNAPPSNSCLPGFGGVTALSTTAVWAVGSDWGNCQDSPPYPLIERWNGTAWKVVFSPNRAGQLSAVAAASTGNVWAVGQLYNLQQAATYHSDGTQWSEVANPTLPFSQLSGIAATSAGDFWAVGSYSPQNSNNRTLIEFYC